MLRLSVLDGQLVSRADSSVGISQMLPLSWTQHPMFTLTTTLVEAWDRGSEEGKNLYWSHSG
jgi:hypothetical protein